MASCYPILLSAKLTQAFGNVVNKQTLPPCIGPCVAASKLLLLLNWCGGRLPLSNVTDWVWAEQKRKKSKGQDRTDYNETHRGMG
eukprot:scaffold61881_cov36-Prasinocladus_malaysianus.AAC.2